MRISGSGGGHNEDDLGHSGESMARFSDFVELGSERQQISALLGIVALKYFLFKLSFCWMWNAFTDTSPFFCDDGFKY